MATIRNINLLEPLTEQLENMMNGDPTISDMLNDLAANPQDCDDFNSDPEAYMTAFGLGNQDKQIVLAYIEQNSWEPGPFLEEYAPELRESLQGLIIC